MHFTLGLLHSVQEFGDKCVPLNALDDLDERDSDKVSPSWVSALMLLLECILKY